MKQVSNLKKEVSDYSKLIFELMNVTHLNIILWCKQHQLG